MKLLVGTPPIYCPECKIELDKMSSTEERVVLKHGSIFNCANNDKLFSIPAHTVEAAEI